MFLTFKPPHSEEEEKQMHRTMYSLEKKDLQDYYAELGCDAENINKALVASLAGLGFIEQLAEDGLISEKEAEEMSVLDPQELKIYIDKMYK